MAVTWERVKLATTSHGDMTQLIDIIESGFPKFCHELPLALQEYYQFHSHTNLCLTACHECLTLSTPRCDFHDGIGESTVLWPGITRAIIALRETCNHCNRMAPMQPSAPPSPAVPPAYPFQCIYTDFFHHKGVNYLAVVDLQSLSKTFLLFKFDKNWPNI